MVSKQWLRAGGLSRLPPQGNESITMLWVVTIVFIVACFISGAWLGNKLSSIPPIVTKNRASTEQVDRATRASRDYQSSGNCAAAYELKCCSTGNWFARRESS
jgi:hypothetical protein